MPNVPVEFIAAPGGPTDRYQDYKHPHNCEIIETSHVAFFTYNGKKMYWNLSEYYYDRLVNTGRLPIATTLGPITLTWVVEKSDLKLDSLYG